MLVITRGYSKSHQRNAQPLFQIARHFAMAMAGALLDWENLRSRGVQPSFSLPSSHHGVRWNVPRQKIVSGIMDWATTYDHGGINIDPLLYIYVHYGFMANKIGFDRIG